MDGVIIKSATELEALRRAGAVVGDALALGRRLCVPGARPTRVARAMEQLIGSRGATATFKGYRGFPAAVCVSVNDAVVHGVPGWWRRLRDGDVVSLDVGATLDGWVGDAAITVYVGEPRAHHAEAMRLLEGTRAALRAGLDVVRPGNRLGDIGARIEATLKEASLGVVRSYCGHGIGRQLHEDPQVPNIGPGGVGPTIEAGWALAVEPAATLGDGSVRTDSDGWTVRSRDGALAAHFEMMVAATASGPRLLSLTSDGHWP